MPTNSVKWRATSQQQARVLVLQLSGGSHSVVEMVRRAASDNEESVY